jgi:hypothetical protein
MRVPRGKFERRLLPHTFPSPFSPLGNCCALLTTATVPTGQPPAVHISPTAFFSISHVRQLTMQNALACFGIRPDKFTSRPLDCLTFAWKPSSSSAAGRQGHRCSTVRRNGWPSLSVSADVLLHPTSSVPHMVCRKPKPRYLILGTEGLQTVLLPCHVSRWPSTLCRRRTRRDRDSCKSLIS